MKNLLIVLAMLLGGTINLYSQVQTSYEKYIKQGNDAYNNGNYELAIDYFTQTLDLAKENIDETPLDFIISLNNIATCYSALGDYKTAIEVQNSAINIAKKKLGEYHPYIAILLGNLAEDYESCKNYSKALELHKQALKVKKAILGESHIDFITSLGNIAECCFSLGDIQTAIKFNTQALGITKDVLGENHPEYILILNNLAGCYDTIGDYLTAIKFNKQALDVVKHNEGKLHPDYAKSLNNLAACYNSIGDYAIAKEIAAESLEIYRNIYGELHPDFVRGLNNLSVMCKNLGEYTIAIELQSQALLTIRSYMGEKSQLYGICLNNLADYYHAIGEYNTAIQLNKQALEIIKNNVGELHLDYAISLNNLAACYVSIGDYALAKELCNQVLIIFQQTSYGSHLSYATSIANLANIYYEFGEYDMAIKIGKKAFKIFKKYKNHSSCAQSLNIIAASYSRIKDYSSAIKLYERSVKVLKSSMDNYNPIIHTTTLANLTFCYLKVGKYNQIVPLRYEVFNSQKKNAICQFQGMKSQTRQVFWISNILPSQVVLNNLCTKVLSNDKQSMGLSYNSLLFSKGVILASDIEFDKVIRESGDTVLLEKFEELRTTRAILNTYYNKPIAERPEGEVERLEARAEVLEKDLLAGSKEYADFTRRLEIEWQDVQAALGDKDVAIEILAADEHIDEDTPPYYAALVLRKGWDAPKFVELCGAEELQAYFDSENGLAIMYREANSRKLYNLIWGKLAEHINEGDNVYFSPGGLLHQINVELLQDSDGRLANKKYNLHRVSSTRELYFEKPKIAHSEAVLYGGLMYDMDSTAMVAQSRAVRPKEEFYAMRGLPLDSLRGKLNYLSASKTEVEKISKQMNQHGIKTTLYVEQIGNEESFKALSGKKTPIIHLATHGFFFRNEEAKVKPFFRMMSMDQERPRPDNSLRRSGLAFAGAQKAWDGEEIPKGIDDGVMLAQEIASMDLAGTDLVVLSACETGLGEINSEGVFGLQRAFKKAGVQTLIMSLWKVHDDATALFMRTFYDNLLSGKSKRDSFAAAQMALREHKQYGADPYYWAGFIMLD